MADSDVTSKQLAILKFLTDHLEGINPSNENPATGEPYTTDLSGSVVRGVLTIGSDRKVPLLAINEPPTPTDSLFADAGATKKKEVWRLLLQGFAEADENNSNDPAYLLKAITEQRLSRLVEETQGRHTFPEGKAFAKLVIAKLKVHQGVVRPPDDKVSPTAFFYIPLTIEMGTDICNPYHQET